MLSLSERINALLPQTQCTKCGYDGCKPYATAIAAGEADINQCPPGGAEGIEHLAALLGREAKSLNPANGVEKRIEPVALIDEAICIGCTLCIQACPVDAIVGANNLMHTVIAAQCTGCELCLPPCPVDCITLEIPSDKPKLSWTQKRLEADASRARYEARLLRLQRDKQEKAESLERKKAALAGRTTAQDPIAAALARAQARKVGTKPP
jgi:electron transport complex protein RnfB